MKTMITERRDTLKKIGVVGAAAVWHKPIINSVLLPAHAQTSATADSIVASSLDGDNPFARFLLIVDSADNVLANCGTSGGTATATDLNPGQYRVFADSDGPQNQIITVSTGVDTQALTVPTNTGACNFLVATVDLPSGLITPASGQQITGAWTCMSNQGVACS